MPSPPKWTDRARRSLTSPLHVSWPVSAGRNVVRIFSSSGSNSLLVSGMVLARNVHLLASPRVNAACAAWG